MVEHGGNIAEVADLLACKTQEMIDFSANINPLGLSPRLKTHMISVLERLTRYPDYRYQEARGFLAQYHGQEINTILLGNGAVGLFYELAAYLKPQTLLTLSPTFMEYEKAFQQVGSKMSYCILEAPRYEWCYDDIRPYIENLQAGDVVLICNPNNPTGSLVTHKELTKIAIDTDSRGLYLIIDEAFIEFLDNESNYSFIPLLKDFPNVIIVRSLTKFYAIPGLRLGYAISNHPNCFEWINQQRAPWTINAIAESVIPVMLTDDDYIQKTRYWLKQEQVFLYEALAAIPCLNPVRPSANYIFFDYQGQQDDLRQRLWEKKILIRSCHNYHHLKNNHYRIAIRSHEDNVALIKALKEVLTAEDRL